MVDPRLGRTQHQVILRRTLIFVAEAEGEEERPVHDQDPGNIIGGVEIIQAEIRLVIGIRKVFSPRIAPVLICVEDLGICLHDGEGDLKQGIPGQQIAAPKMQDIVAARLGGRAVAHACQTGPVGDVQVMQSLLPIPGDHIPHFVGDPQIENIEFKLPVGLFQD